MDKKIQKLEALLKLVDEGISKADFVSSFENVVALVAKVQKKMLDDNEANVLGMQNRLDKAVEDLISKIEKALKEQEDGMNFIKDKVRRIKEGVDGYTPQKGIDYVDGYTPQKGIDYADGEPGKDGSPDTPEEIRDKLISLNNDDSLPIEAIKDLRKELDELRKLKGRLIGGGGGGAMSASHSPLHEAFTMNGVSTTVTLSAGVAAQGNAIIVRYQGQTLDMTSMYTVNGNLVTLVGFIPENGTIISVTYWP